MGYYYSNPEHESDPHALPDVEVFETKATDYLHTSHICHGGPGWFYAFGAFGFPWGSDPVGPFDTEEAALEAAREE